MMSESKTPESGVREQGMEAVVIPNQKLNYGIRAMMQERISREELDRAFDARFPKEMQRKLRGGRVAVAGLGGLGSNIAVMLARSGVGKLLLVDEPADVPDSAAGKAEGGGASGDSEPDQSLSGV